ncbi:Cell division protein FtsQ [Anatilimnocola aggregata]|uniref:Cell division protein FtsQ n=1 Tax=Anatilimnocola aggregata TaxID=2528021 RepID=A0A517YLN5_9BACT|nr:hypothetical protein [Anatilimnocola aggregata]QDU31123.1 Cell division protein FtsQ [Anatilimnocola aggregata]
MKHKSPAPSPVVPQGPSAASLVRLLFRKEYRIFFVAIVLMVSCYWGFQESWRRWGEPSLASEPYQVTPQQIIVTSQPPWIEGDVKAEAIRDGSLTKLDLRDRTLLERIRRAFAVHNWVAQVKQVRKSYPARVDVELVYRRPMASVEVTYRGRPELLLIDEQGILLPSPSEAFAARNLPDMLRIDAGDTAPAGPYGTDWGSPRVTAAAKIATAWTDQWKAIGLYRIVVTEDTNGRIGYELQTRNGGRCLWGNPPGQETANEPKPAEKVARAISAHQQGQLKDDADSPPIDLSGGTVPMPTRTATRNRRGLR